MTRTISAVALLVPDYDAGIAFYCGVLGFDLIADEVHGPGRRRVTVQPG